jgi:hypothetical protein
MRGMQRTIMDRHRSELQHVIRDCQEIECLEQ